MPTFTIDMEATADLMGLTDVHRWTVVKTMRNQNVAEHSYGVAILTTYLLDSLGIQSYYDVLSGLRWALIHDAPETLSGDIDGKFKRDYPAVKEAVNKAEDHAFPWYQVARSGIPVYIQALVKLADHIEAIVFLSVWGVGDRAIKVATVLEKQTIEETVPYVDKCLQMASYGVRPGELVTLTQNTIDKLIAERHTIQFRGK